jgi:xanthine dehydrogenase accessory factor
LGSSKDLIIVIKGAGEMASAIAHRLFKANFKQICMTEIKDPVTVRRMVAFSEAVYDGSMVVEDVAASLAKDRHEIAEIWAEGRIAVLIDPRWKIVDDLKPDVVIDAILAKRNLGTVKDEAPLVIGVGPGFSAPQDVHVVVESSRGHNLGRTIYEGTAEPHTGVPGSIRGYANERVLRSPHAGTVHHMKSIGEMVKKGDLVLLVDRTPVLASIDGVIRGLIREIPVFAGRKLGDIDPRGEVAYCYSISDKARAIAGGVLKAVAGWALRLSMEEEHG